MNSLSSGATITYYEYLYEITEEHIPTKLMYGWSKHGGATKGMVQQQADVWFCQSCKHEFAKIVPSFMFPMFHREFARICQPCLDIAIAKRFRTIWEMLRMYSRDDWR